MKRRLRERAQPASPSARKRKSRSAEVEACIEEEALISDLDELLRNEEEAAWWTGDGRLPTDDSPLVDLLQQLAACDEGETCQDFTEGASSFPKMAAAPSSMAAAAPRQRGSVNRNAQAARLNRLRKKEYVSGLEGKVARLSEDNQRLERERRGLEERVHRLEEESRYLRAVLANDSALSQLLGRLTGLGGVKLSTSLFNEREEKPREHDYALLPPVVEEMEPPSGGGVCLHVEQDKVSVEFCPACSRSAAASTAKM